MNKDIMRAMMFKSAGQPLELLHVAVPCPQANEVLIAIDACAVCRTDLHVVDGDLSQPKLPLVPGHEIVGRIVRCGDAVQNLSVGTRVGVPWLGWTCGTCEYCRAQSENLCPQAQFTGYTRDGGFAEYCVADARYCFVLPEVFDDVGAAPLMCAGLIGFRSYRKIEDARRVGLYGFGAAAHILAQVAVFEGKVVYAFTKPGDDEGQKFARSLGCAWAGGSDVPAPEPLDAAIIFAPVGALIPQALRAVRPGGRVICAGIHMTDIPSFSYNLLWSERMLQSVANLTRKDGEEFLQVAPQVPVRTVTKVYALEEANMALDDLRHGRFEGAAVLVPNVSRLRRDGLGA